MVAGFTCRPQTACLGLWLGLLIAAYEAATVAAAVGDRSGSAAAHEPLPQRQLPLPREPTAAASISAAAEGTSRRRSSILEAAAVGAVVASAHPAEGALARWVA